MAVVIGIMTHLHQHVPRRQNNNDTLIVITTHGDCVTHDQRAASTCSRPVSSWTSPQLAAASARVAPSRFDVAGIVCYAIATESRYMLIFIMVFHDTARKMYNNHVTQRVFLSVCYVWVFVLIWHADLFQCRNCSVLTPHTTWQIHPADRSLFRSLNHHWTEEGLKTARQHAAMKLKQ